MYKLNFSCTVYSRWKPICNLTKLVTNKGNWVTSQKFHLWSLIIFICDNSELEKIFYLKINNQVRLSAKYLWSWIPEFLSLQYIEGEGCTCMYVHPQYEEYTSESFQASIPSHPAFSIVLFSLTCAYSWACFFFFFSSTCTYMTV